MKMLLAAWPPPIPEGECFRHVRESPQHQECDSPPSPVAAAPGQAALASVPWCSHVCQHQPRESGQQVPDKTKTPLASMPPSNPEGKCSLHERDSPQLQDCNSPPSQVAPASGQAARTSVPVCCSLCHEQPWETGQQAPNQMNMPLAASWLSNPEEERPRHE